jgi:hypothetical protein
MDDTVEKSYFYDTNSGPDPERHPRQTNYDEQSQPRILRHRNLKENNESIMEYGEEQEVRALYQPMCGL